MRLDLRVDLKAADLVSRSARMALEETLGWKGVLLGLRRSDLWRFRGEGDRFRESLEKEVARTSFFVNTTKHRAEFAVGEKLGEGQVLDPAEALGPAEVEGDRRWRLRLYVTEEGGDRQALRKRVEPRLAGAKLASLSFGLLWEIVLAVADEKMARGALTGLAISRSRERGLLLNPHFQEGRLLSLEEVSER